MCINLLTVFSNVYAEDNICKIKLDLEEKAKIDATVAMINSDGSCGGDNEGATNNALENAQNPCQEATNGTNSDSSEGEGVDRYGSSCNGTMGAAASKDGQDHVIIAIAMALELEDALKRERRKKRRMEKVLRAHQLALQEKWRGREMIMKKKQDMLAEEAANQKLVDNFMAFIEAIEKNYPEIAQKFDEKAMMNTILPLMNSDSCDSGNGGDNGGFAGGDNVPKIRLDIEEKATMINSDGGCGADNEGGTNNTPEKAQNPGQ
ncbi:hypothetical protein DITRI_Ditri06bG0134500 [Diplodiscus trichospermus]